MKEEKGNKAQKQTRRNFPASVSLSGGEYPRGTEAGKSEREGFFFPLPFLDQKKGQKSWQAREAEEEAEAVLSLPVSSPALTELSSAQLSPEQTRELHGLRLLGEEAASECVHQSYLYCF